MNNNSRNITFQSSGSSSGARSGNQNDGVRTKYAIVKEGWGSRKEFQHSYLLGMDAEGIEEGNRILEGYQEMERQELEARRDVNSGK